jgi:hypothetical protein
VWYLLIVCIVWLKHGAPLDSFNCAGEPCRSDACTEDFLIKLDHRWLVLPAGGVESQQLPSLGGKPRLVFSPGGCLIAGSAP